MYVLNYVVKISMMFAKYFEYYTIILRGPFFVDTVYIGSVTARHSRAGVSRTLRRATRNRITELSQRAPPVFSSAAITLGIGPHSSLFLNCSNDSELRCNRCILDSV